MFVKIAFEGQGEPQEYGEVDLAEIGPLVQVFGTNITEDADGQQYEFADSRIEETPFGRFRFVIYLKKMEEPTDLAEVVSRLKSVMSGQ